MKDEVDGLPIFLKKSYKKYNNKYINKYIQPLMVYETKTDPEIQTTFRTLRTEDLEDGGDGTVPSWP